MKTFACATHPTAQIALSRSKCGIGPNSNFTAFCAVKCYKWNPPMKFPAARAHGFTLIELIVVILIIAALAALLVPAASRTLDPAKRAQAKNDVIQIVTAVNAFYTEYGKYPLALTITTDANAIFPTDNSDVINTLRAVPSGANALNVLNPRKIVFLSPRQIGSGTKGGVADTPLSGNPGIYYDPWGKNANAALVG